MAWIGHGHRRAIGAVAVGAVTGCLVAGSSVADPRHVDDPAAPFGLCGTKISGQLRGDRRLAITAALPKQPHPATNATVSVDVQITNESTETVDAITSLRPEVAVVRDGVVVSAPAGMRDVGIPITLEPGASAVYGMPVKLNDCRAIVIAGKIPTGNYDLYAVQRFSPPTLGDVPAPLFAVRGGPWRLQVR